MRAGRQPRILVQRSISSVLVAFIPNHDKNIPRFVNGSKPWFFEFILFPCDDPDDSFKSILCIAPIKENKANEDHFVYRPGFWLCQLCQGHLASGTETRRVDGDRRETITECSICKRETLEHIIRSATGTSDIRSTGQRRLVMYGPSWRTHHAGGTVCHRQISQKWYKDVSDQQSSHLG
jgi:hypothetical protein